MSEPGPPNPQSRRLRDLAERIVREFEGSSMVRGAILVGSVGAGSADEFSDIDLILYYDRLPTKGAIRTFRKKLSLPDEPPPKTNRGVGYAMKFELDGFNCDTSHQFVSFVNRVLDELLSGQKPDSVGHQKTAQGLSLGFPIRDDGVIAEWRARLAEFPDELAQAMAEQYLRIWPYWKVEKWVAARDAQLFELQSLVKGALNVIGALSGANRLYFSTFHFKRMRDHIAAMEEAPPNLAERIESLFANPRATAVEELRKLVAETVEIVERRLPDVDTTQIRKDLE